MGLETAPFDVVEASRRVWLAHWPAEAASGMAVYTAVLRSFQMLNAQVNQVVRRHGLSFSRYEVLTWPATDAESSVTLSWISRTLRLPPATATDIIDRLERDGLVRREPHPSDARTTLARRREARRSLRPRLPRPGRRARARGCLRQRMPAPRS
jgi:DNA-binding MarR family transcriptional regulator